MVGQRPGVIPLPYPIKTTAEAHSPGGVFFKEILGVLGVLGDLRVLGDLGDLGVFTLDC
jgi:hypothetical protein